MKPKRKFILIVVCMSLILVASVSAFYCIDDEDNEAVKVFKSNLNRLALKEDIRNGLTPEAVSLKIKYFNSCE